MNIVLILYCSENFYCHSWQCTKMCSNSSLMTAVTTKPCPGNLLQKAGYSGCLCLTLLEPKALRHLQHTCNVLPCVILNVRCSAVITIHAFFKQAGPLDYLLSHIGISSLQCLPRSALFGIVARDPEPSNSRVQEQTHSSPWNQQRTGRSIRAIDVQKLDLCSVA